MMTLDTEPNQWKPETATAALLETERPAGYQVVWYPVKAEAARLNSVERCKDRYSASSFQGRNWHGCFRLLSRKA